MMIVQQCTLQSDEDHPAVAAAFRDHNELVQLIYLPLFTSEQLEPPLEEQADDGPAFESEFGKTRIAQQAKHLIEALEQIDQDSQEN